MVEFYSGPVNITSQYSRFYLDGDQPRAGRRADGDFSGEEVSLFAGEEGAAGDPNTASVLTFVRGELARLPGANPTELAARFEAYVSYIRNGCEGVTEGTPVAQAMYEEITQYIESDRFARATDVMQARIVGLQADLFARLAQRGTHRGNEARGGGGTAVEDVQFNPVTEDFLANPRVLENVPLVSQNLVTLEGEAAEGLEDMAGMCVYRQQDARTRDVNYNVYPSGTGDAQPFSSGMVRSVSRSFIVDNMTGIERMTGPETEEWLSTFFTTLESSPGRLIVRSNIERVIATEVAAGRMTQDNADYLQFLLQEPVNMDFRYGRHQRPEDLIEDDAQPTPEIPLAEAGRPSGGLNLNLDDDPLGGGGDDLGF